jgi:CBS-domain-containing membrane protein
MNRPGEAEMHTVEDAMTADVVTVDPDASVTVAARIMRDAGVSGLPVVDCDGCLVGIVTEADLLHRAVVPDSTEDEARHSARDRWPGSTVADLMSREVIGARRDDPLAKAARLMEKARVRRLVVVGNGFALEGIISRSDVVAALARPDTDIEAEIRAEVVRHILGIDPDTIDVSVCQGVVTLVGSVTHRREAVRLERLARSVLGVSSVDSSVTWQIDDRFAGRVPRFGFFTGGRHTTRGDHDDSTKDNRGAL